MTLEEAKQEVIANRDEGITCPCCGQLAKVYKRLVYGSMAVDLIRLYQKHMFDDDWNKYYHISKVRTVTAGGGDFAKFVYWGLVEEQQKDPDDLSKRTSGFWRITNIGKAFVEKKTQIMKYVIIYDSNVLRFEGDLVDIESCLRGKFNYQELMNR